MNLPITSKIKRSPLLETIDPNKRSKSKVANKIKKGADTEKEITVKGKDTKVKKKYVGAANDACSKEYIAANGKDACDKYKALSQEKKDKGNLDIVKGKDEKKTVIVKGETTKGNNYSKQTQTRLGPADILRNQRSNKRSSKYVRQSQDDMDKYDRKMSKYGARNAEGVFVAREGLSSYQKKRLGKHTSRYNESKNNNTNAKNSASRVTESQASGKVIGGSIRRSDDRINSMGDYSNEEQDKMNADNAAATAEAQANTPDITVGNDTKSKSADKAVEVTDSAPPVAPLGTEKVEQGVKKVDTTYKEAGAPKMKKDSPYRMMGNNPVSSNRVKSRQNFTKSPYQMRGSMFKK